MSVPIIKFLFNMDWPVLNDSLAIQPTHESLEIASASEVLTFLGNQSAGLVITSLRDKNDLIQLATLSKLSKKSLSNCSLKIVVVNFSRDKQFEKAVSKLGILDLVETNINTKALRYKVDFWLKALNATVKKNAQSQGTSALKSVETNKKEEAKSSLQDPVWLDPLECEDDIWLLKSNSQCKRLLSKWVVKFMGPSPYLGQWTDAGKAGFWRFDIKEENRDLFMSGRGSWFFKGEQKPDFLWKENRWLMTGDDFELFYKEEKTIYSRVKLKDRVFCIAKDSMFAQTKEEMIVQSFDKDVVVKKDNVFSDESDSLEADNEVYENLEGKGKTESIKRAPLSGKGETSHLDLDPLSGKGSTSQLDHGPLKGRSSEEAPSESRGYDLAVDPKLKASKNLDLETSNKHQKHYRNHNETERYDAKDLSHTPEAKSQEQDPYELDHDPKIEQSKNLDLETSNKHQKHYKNHNETEKYDAKDLSHSGGKKKTSEAPEGQGHTDKLSSLLKSKGVEKKPIDADEVFNKHGYVGKAPIPIERSIEDNVYPIVPESEKDLERASQNAKVTSFLLQDLKKVACQLDDFFDQTVIFRAQEDGILSTQRIKLDLTFEFQKKETKLKLDANVVNVEKDDEGINFITVEISDKDLSEFNTFIKLYESRQKDISFFLKTAKGL